MQALEVWCLSWSSRDVKFFPSSSLLRNSPRLKFSRLIARRARRSSRRRGGGHGCKTTRKEKMKQWTRGSKQSRRVFSYPKLLTSVGVWSSVGIITVHNSPRLKCSRLIARWARNSRWRCGERHGCKTVRRRKLNNGREIRNDLSEYFLTQSFLHQWRFSHQSG